MGDKRPGTREERRGERQGVLWRLMRPSTRSFVREWRELNGHRFFDLVHGYVYGRWPYFYIAVGTGEHPLARVLGPIARWILAAVGDDGASGATDGGDDFANGYHGKAVPLEQATQLVKVEEEIRLTNLEKVIPYERARDIVLRNPDHIVVLDCPCRAAREEPCLPLDVCLIIGEPFASFVADHHPERARWIEREEAMAILKAEDERGHVHHAFFKDGMLERFYAICNCCSCCCGAMQAHRMGVPMLASSGYVSQVDRALCTGCGECTAVCPFGAVCLEGGVAVVNATDCMGCGVCLSRCDWGATKLVRDTSKGEPLDLRVLVTESG